MDDQFMSELKKLFDTLMMPKMMPQGGPEITKEVEDSYKAYGFDPKKPPNDSELAHWATKLIYQWHADPPTNVNLPLAGLCVGYNMTTWGKLSQLDQMNLKTLLCAVFNMGYNMGAYKLKSPFDPKPKPQDLN